MNEHFVYTPLSSTQNTRLLNLAPGSYADPICCSLFPASVDAMPGYEALSYTWGDPNRTLPIQLEHCSHQVTVNLENALRRLRHADCAKVLWVDALCINQADVDEKLRQIGHMREIYTCAETVVVWLGEEADEEGHSVSAALELCAAIERRSVQREAVDPETGRPGVMVDTVVVHEGYDAYWEACRLLFSRAWWTRAWILQEVIHDRPVEVYIGHQIRMPLDELCEAFNVYWAEKQVRDQARMARREPKSIARGGGFDVEPKETNYSMWLRTVEAEGIPDSMLRMRARATNRPLHEGDFPYPPRLGLLLMKFREQGASVAKDRIFALRSMAVNKDDIPLDWYSLPLDSIYIRTTRVFLQNTLLVLLWIESPSRKVEDGAALPSWVPDYETKQDLVAKCWISSYLHFSADAGFPMVAQEPRSEDTLDSRVLTLRGVYVGIVTEAYDARISTEPDIEARSAVRLVRYSTDHADRERAVGPAGHESAWRPVPDAMKEQMTFRNTSWGPPQTRSGDVIIVAAGCKVPLILRSLSAGGYLLVGACWLIESPLKDISNLNMNSGFSDIMFGGACSCSDDRNPPEVELFRIY